MFNTFGLLSSLYVTLFGAVFLFAASDKVYKNRYYLSLFFINGFVLFLGHVLSLYEYWKVFRYLDFAFLSSLLLFYPLYYRYLNSAFGYKINYLKWSYQFAPAIIFGVLMLFASYTANWSSYSNYMDNSLYGTPLDNFYSKILNYLYRGSRYMHVIQILVYNYLAIRYIFKIRQKIENSYSNLDKTQLKYFYVVNIVFLLFMALPGIYVTIVGRTPFMGDDYKLGMVTFLFTFLYVILGFVGLRQTPFTPSEIKHNEGHINDFDQIENDYSVIKSRLLELFEHKKVWRDPNLNIWDIAYEVVSNRTYVSRLINKEFKCNFNVFVNNYRINEAKSLLENSDNKKLSMDDIADLAGFGSQSSLLRVFKESTGLTPYKYRKLKS